MKNDSFTYQLCLIFKHHCCVVHAYIILLLALNCPCSWKDHMSSLRIHYVQYSSISAFEMAALFYFSFPRGKVWNVTCSWLQACVSSSSCRKESRAFSTEPWSICVSHTHTRSIPSWVAVQWNHRQNQIPVAFVLRVCKGERKNKMLCSTVFSTDQVRKANLTFRPLTLFYPLHFASEFLFLKERKERKDVIA